MYVSYLFGFKENRILGFLNGYILKNIFHKLDTDQVDEKLLAELHNFNRQIYWVASQSLSTDFWFRLFPPLRKKVSPFYFMIRWQLTYSFSSLTVFFSFMLFWIHAPIQKHKQKKP